MDGRKTHYFLTDVSRAFFGKRFCISVAGVVLALFFSLQDLGDMEVSVLYVFMLSTYGTGFGLSLVFCTFCYGTVFAEELESCYVKYSIIRGNVRKYVASKLAAIFLSSAAVMAAACGIFPLLCFSLQLPWSDEQTLLEFLPSVSFRGLMLNGHFLLWFILYGVQQGIFAGCMSAAAAFFSLYVSNRLLVLAVPVLLYQIILDFGEGIRSKVPCLDPSVVFDARYHLFSKDGLVAGWALLYAALFCGIIGAGCVRKIKKRM